MPSEHEDSAISSRKWLRRGVVLAGGAALVAGALLLASTTFVVSLFNLVLCLLDFCVYDNVADVTVSGRVRDNQGRPLAHAEVLARCEFEHDIDKASWLEQERRVQPDGGFSFRFEQCSVVALATKAPRFLPARKTGLHGKNHTVDFALEPAPKAVTAIARKMSLHSGRGPHVSLRSRPGSVEPWGYDIINGAQTGDLEAADLWLDPAKKPSHDEYPATFVTGGRGGILPIFRAGLRHTSAWFRPEEAPSTGYKRKYALRGGEAGLFVRCRDGVTYAKVIFSGVWQTYGCAGEQSSTGCQEWGRSFGVLYQPDGTTNLSYAEDVDLGFFMSGSLERDRVDGSAPLP